MVVRMVKVVQKSVSSRFAHMTNAPDQADRVMNGNKESKVFEE